MLFDTQGFCTCFFCLLNVDWNISQWSGMGTTFRKCGSVMLLIRVNPTDGGEGCFLPHSTLLLSSSALSWSLCVHTAPFSEIRAHNCISLRTVLLYPHYINPKVYQVHWRKDLNLQVNKSSEEKRMEVEGNVREITSPFMEFFVKARVVIRSSCRVQAKFTSVNASFFSKKEVKFTFSCTVGGGALQKLYYRGWTD